MPQPVKHVPVTWRCLECGLEGPGTTVRDENNSCANPDCNPEKDEGGLTKESRTHVNKLLGK